MSSSHLEADFSALASTIRSRLHRHWSHRFKVRVYGWWDAVLVAAHSLAQTALSLGLAAMSMVDTHSCKLASVVGGLERKSPGGVTAPGDAAENFVVTRVSR